MLGPALTHLLGRLAVIPQGQRTEEQEALFTELHLLFLALPGRPKSTHVKLDAHLREVLAPPYRDRLFSITEPYDPNPVTSVERCKNCHQVFPVTTQP